MEQFILQSEQIIYHCEQISYTQINKYKYKIRRKINKREGAKGRKMKENRRGVTTGANCSATVLSMQQEQKRMQNSYREETRKEAQTACTLARGPASGARNRSRPIRKLGWPCTASGDGSVLCNVRDA